MAHGSLVHGQGGLGNFPAIFYTHSPSRAAGTAFNSYHLSEGVTYFWKLVFVYSKSSSLKDTPISHWVKPLCSVRFGKKLTSKAKYNGVNIVVMFKAFIPSLKRITYIYIYILHICMLYIMVFPYGKKKKGGGGNTFSWDIFLKISL